MSFKAYKVVLLKEAIDDIKAIYSFIEQNDSTTSAEYVLKKLEKSIRSLEILPNRGHIPPELERFRISIFREIRFKPYRIIYETEQGQVTVHCVLDGRRDVKDLLSQRLQNNI
jgi:toxin ParE1/3/4